MHGLRATTGQHETLMGSIIITRSRLLGSLTETAGYKSGLVLTKELLIEHLPDYEDYLVGDDDDVLRVRSEVYEEMFVELLTTLGAAPKRRSYLLGMGFVMRYKDDPTLKALAEDVLQVFIKMNVAAQPGTGPIDLTPFLKECGRLHGAKGFELGMAFVEDITASLHRSPWNQFRLVDWKDRAELKDLFQSEHLTTQYGKFFDQRYIDYLNENFGAIDRINWRKFEGLTAEHFEREGFLTKLGPGRDDGNIDVRIWPKEAKEDMPPLILVQCKRQESKVGKVVVKALYADIVHEGAKSGLIVTTSSLAPGAAEVRTARGYPIEEVNRGAVRKWIEAMRTPENAVFLGE